MILNTRMCDTAASLVSLGLDVGSVTTKIVALSVEGRVVHGSYLRTNGRPITAIQECLREVKRALGDGVAARAIGTTGSGRHLAGTLVRADLIKNEIICHAVAAMRAAPTVRTVIEIGGQDSKIIILRNGIPVDFAMNTVCAAGTGSFLEQQANRLNIPIEDFAEIALRATAPVRIAGRCTVFAESDMIHKQQMGYSLEDILAGLAEALVRNFLSNVGKGKEIASPVIFQGGVAANRAIARAFERELGFEIVVPENFELMGAIGAALLAERAVNGKSSFTGFDIAEMAFRTRGFTCTDCSNQCEIMELCREDEMVSRWGDRCGKWDPTFVTAP
jgi:predicted CoA-substrate-specific enzyme activase